MRKFVLALTLLLSASLSAATADLRLLSMAPSLPPTVTGERFVMFIRWQNFGPDVAQNVLLTINGSPTPFYVTSTATSGWPCYPTADGKSFRCNNPGLASGGAAELVLTMLAPPTPGTFTIDAEIHSDANDPNPGDNRLMQSFNVAAAPATVDLSMSPTTQSYNASTGSTVTMPFNITNNGTSAATNLFAVFSVPVSLHIPPYSGAGEGWSCVHPPYGANLVICTNPHLAAGASAPITLTMTAPQTSGTVTINARVGSEGAMDPSPANNYGAATVNVGTTQTETWTRTLVPITAADVPGANGALWRTQTTALITSEMQIYPDPCDRPVGAPTCINSWQFGKPFDLYDVLALGGLTYNTGLFIYTRAEDESRLRLNSRVWDVSRFAETAGSEIPVARERDFTSDTISLLGIPVAPEYRHTLRVYDLEGRNGSRVAIRIYSGNETTPRLDIVRTLQVPVQQEPITPEGTRAFPAYLQAELGQLLPLAGLNDLRVDIQPLDEDLKIWAFVSATNNNTHHVTTFSKQ